MAAFDTTIKEGCRGKASMLDGPASAWATAMHGASTACHSNNHVIVAGRHTLGLSVLLQVEMQTCLCGVGNAGSPDHAMACYQKKGKATLRQDLLTSAWRFATHQAGCASSMKSAYDRASQWRPWLAAQRHPCSHTWWPHRGSGLSHHTHGCPVQSLRHFTGCGLCGSTD